MSLINISEGSSLALHSLSLIVKNKQTRMNVKILAEKLNASQAHLAKIFQKLSKAGLVNSVRGPSGGFELNKIAEDISFLKIYEIIEGKVVLNKCPLNKNYCAFEKCIFTNKLSTISHDIYKVLKETKLSDMN